MRFLGYSNLTYPSEAPHKGEALGCSHSLTTCEKCRSLAYSGIRLSPFRGEVGEGLHSPFPL